MRILLVEDNRQLSDWLAKTLSKDRYAIECAYDGEDANFRLRSEIYDLVVLDLGIPRLSGEEVLQRIRARGSNVPVLILTARDSTLSRIQSLDNGADDYMIKPFDVAELEARIRVLLRRVANHKSPVMHCGNLTLNTNTLVFSVGANELQLTPREHAVLEALLVKLGKTMSKSQLAETLFTMDESVSPDSIEIYVHRLRKKWKPSSATLPS